MSTESTEQPGAADALKPSTQIDRDLLAYLHIDPAKLARLRDALIDFTPWAEPEEVNPDLDALIALITQWEDEELDIFPARLGWAWWGIRSRDAEVAELKAELQSVKETHMAQLALCADLNPGTLEPNPYLAIRDRVAALKTEVERVEKDREGIRGWAIRMQDEMEKQAARANAEADRVAKLEEALRALRIAIENTSASFGWVIERIDTTLADRQTPTEVPAQPKGGSLV